MGKVVHNDVLDAMLDKIATCDELTVCSAEPTNLTEATTTYKLADVALTPGDGNGDFTIADGDVSGRKVTISQQASIDIDSDGTATHIAYNDDTTVLFVTTCTSQGLTSGGTVTVPAHDIEVADPS